jgi:hypothetical protein
MTKDEATEILKAKGYNYAELYAEALAAAGAFTDGAEKRARLSSTQAAMMRRLAACDPACEETPGFGCGRDSGRIASAWHRTAHALKDRGLVEFIRVGDHHGVKLTDAGRVWVSS